MLVSFLLYNNPSCLSCDLLPSTRAFPRRLLVQFAVGFWNFAYSFTRSCYQLLIDDSEPLFRRYLHTPSPSLDIRCLCVLLKSWRKLWNEQVFDPCLCLGITIGGASRPSHALALLPTSAALPIAVSIAFDSSTFLLLRLYFPISGCFRQCNSTADHW